MNELKKMLIEHDIPLEAINEESLRDKYLRHGHISTLHIWWAGRPLAACRAMIYASLIPVPEKESELKKTKEFIGKLVDWDNVKVDSYNARLIERAIRNIRRTFDEKRPKVLDCFAGRGSIPLEALRLGCETYALELNPVAILVEKAILEYPQKHGKKLIKDVQTWGNWILKEANRKVGKFYPKEQDPRQKTISEEELQGMWIPLGYLWARTMKCQNPTCGAEIPLIKQFWLKKEKDSDGKIDWKDSVYLKPIIYKEQKEIKFEIIRGKKIDGFDPAKGTRPTPKARGSFTCPICGSGYKSKDLRKYAKRKGFGQKMIAVILHHPNQVGKIYRIATKNDRDLFELAENTLKRKNKNEMSKYSLLPNEMLPPNGTLGFRVNKYGLKRWRELFNSRQLLVLVTFVEEIRRAYEEIIKKGYDKEYANAIATYLGLALDMQASFCNTLARWENTSEAIKQAFARQALPMLWDYVEVNPFSGSTGTLKVGFNYYVKVLKHCSQIYRAADVKQGTATRLPYPDNFFDAVITDPPYYDNIPYADLSDFFYVWLKRTLREIHPNLFRTPLTPKSEEIIQNAIRHDGDKQKAKMFYEEKLTKSFKEIKRVLKPRGIATIIFAHKSTAAWESLINSFLQSGLVITASWPIHTEMEARLRARASAALASSVFFVCRKVERQEMAYFEDIEEEIKERIQERLDYFWNAGIRGSDFFISSIGPAIEIFGKYKKVKKYSGEEVLVSKLLDFIERYVAEYALKRILKASPGLLDPETRFYLIWRWTYNNNKIPFDDARMLGQALGFEVPNHIGKDKLIEKSGTDVKVLNPQERGKKFLERPLKKSTSMVEVMHKAAVFWKNGEKGKLNKVLEDNGYLDNERFWMFIQAVSEVLPKGDPEKKMLQGLLASRKRIERGPKATKVTDFM